MQRVISYATMYATVYYSTQYCKYKVVILAAYTSYCHVAYGVLGVAKMAAQ